MREKSLFLIGSTPQALEAGYVKQALSIWRQSHHAAARTATFEQVLTGGIDLSGCGVAWVIMADAKASDFYALIAALQDRHLPTMLTRADEEQRLGAALEDGVVIGPPDTSPATLCAMLAALWSQAGSFEALESELKLVRAHDGGLRGQIEMIDEELRLAAQLQREFLPTTLPRIGQVDFRVLFRPAGYVSGDIYDVARLDEKHVGFFIADAVGHGVPAALLTMYIKRSLDTKDIDTAAEGNYRIVRPDEALARLNHDMCQQQSGKVRFATACYGVINCHTLDLTIARAGHPYPMLFRADGSTDMLEPDGPLLGVFPDETFELVQTRLAPGDRLLLYSDGFELAFAAAEAAATTGPAPTAGKTRQRSDDYMHQLRQMADGSLDEALACMIRRLDVQAGSLHQSDDLTALVVGVDRHSPNQMDESTRRACSAAA
ncbi:MAG: SpoIIE family protein phosphatase [Phycisphaeraceae bacterium]